MSVLIKVLAFLLAIGPLVIFHELGHYTVARLCGVKVLRFSFGFGKVLWSRRFGPDQTEWAISMLPLGGYVKMLDNRDPATAVTKAADQPREFTGQTVWRRIAIVAAGPLANFILAIAVFTGLYLHGVEEEGTRIRFMADTTPAWQAGLRGGERIVAVNDKPVASWAALRWEILEASLDKQDLRLDVVQAGGGQLHVLLPVSALAGKDIESDMLGALGLSMARGPAQLGKVLDGGAAAKAGLKSGDVITRIDGAPVQDGLVLMERVRAGAGRTLAFAGVRAGQPFEAAVTPELDPVAKVARIKAEVLSPVELVTVSLGPIEAIARGMHTTWEQGLMQLKMIGKMVVGQVSLKNVTGPITIADYAGKTASLGILPFLTFIAVVSISLGVMNLLPIPVLDGGLLLYYSLEVLTGRPLPERIGQLAQFAGLGLLAMLMALAVFNDVARQL